MTTASLNWKFRVQFDGHDRNSAGGSFLRDTREIAERSASLMQECGYRDVRVVPFLMNPNDTDMTCEELKAIQATL